MPFPGTLEWLEDSDNDDGGDMPERCLLLGSNGWLLPTECQRPQSLGLLVVVGDTIGRGTAFWKGNGKIGTVLHSLFSPGPVTSAWWALPETKADFNSLKDADETFMRGETPTFQFPIFSVDVGLPLLQFFNAPRLVCLGNAYASFPNDQEVELSVNVPENFNPPHYKKVSSNSNAVTLRGPIAETVGLPNFAAAHDFANMPQWSVDLGFSRKEQTGLLINTVKSFYDGCTSCWSTSSGVINQTNGDSISHSCSAFPSWSGTPLEVPNSHNPTDNTIDYVAVHQGSAVPCPNEAIGMYVLMQLYSKGPIVKTSDELFGPVLKWKGSGTKLTGTELQQMVEQAEQQCGLDCIGATSFWGLLANLDSCDPQRAMDVRTSRRPKNFKTPGAQDLHFNFAVAGSEGPEKEEETEV
eukprot:TRINITY_DN67699_c7_g1_i1.p1 TRINITY_DN67699_c7_g1~~TRINITY_DN67699_c7_g1_i1.p1  ORF type:complete len:411 (+),score=23.04 TRINITY_DN67699_c7_g1_i1:76-1308(+)